MPRLQSAEDDAGDQVARDHEEHIDADETAGQQHGKRMKGDHRNDRHCAQSVDVRAILRREPGHSSARAKASADAKRFAGTASIALRIAARAESGMSWFGDCGFTCSIWPSSSRQRRGLERECARDHLVSEDPEREHVSPGVWRSTHQDFRSDVRQFVFAGLLAAQLLLAHGRENILDGLDPGRGDHDAFIRIPARARCESCRG